MNSSLPRNCTIAMLPSADLSYDSGSVIFAKQLANSLASHGAIVHMFAKCSAQGIRLDPSISIHTEPSLLDHPVITDRSITNGELARNEELCRQFLEGLQRSHPIDLVYAQYFSFTSAAASEFARASRVPAIVSSFGRDLDVGVSHDPRIHDLALRSLPYIAVALVPTKSVGIKLGHLSEQAGTRAPATAIIPPPLDEAFLQSTGNEHLKVPGNPLLVTINSCFKPDKGIETTLEATARVRDRGWTNVHLAIAGSDDHPDRVHKQRLLSCVERLALTEHVTFLGYLSRSEVKSLLQHGTIFVDSRMTGGFSSALAEALACGSVSCCARNDASAALVRDGDNGLLFDPHNPADLAMHLIELLEDRHLYARIKERTISWLRSEGHAFTPTETFRSVHDLFAGLVRHRDNRLA